MRRFLGPLVIAIGLLVTACGDDDAGDTAAEPITTGTEAAGSDSDAAIDSDAGADSDVDAEDADAAGGEADEPAEAGTDGELFPDVIGATATQDADGSWTFSATLSSPYDTPERYADGWRVLGPDGEVYGERPLAHDHQNEQPFTRSTSGVVVPDGVDQVTIQGRDQVSGWGGATFELTLER